MENNSEIQPSANGNSEMSVASVPSSHSMNSAEGSEEADNLRYLRNAIDRTVDKCVSSVRLSYFAKNYPAVFKKNLNCIKDLHESYKKKLLSAVNTEIDLMIEKENLEGLLGNFHSLHKDNAKRYNRKAWRPSGKPGRDIAAHLIPRKRRQKEKLQALLDEIQRENKQLTGRVQQRRQHLLATSQRISEKTADMKKCMEHFSTRELSEYMTGVEPCAKDAGQEI